MISLAEWSRDQRLESGNCYKAGLLLANLGHAFRTIETSSLGGTTPDNQKF
jgi:hypothetical protein